MRFDKDKGFTMKQRNMQNAICAFALILTVGTSAEMRVENKTLDACIKMKTNFLEMVC